MTHTRFRALLDDFLDENLSASSRAEMAAHLEDCAACAALKTEREADLKLSRAALGEMTRRSAPPELRLRVRAAIQDERAATRSVLSPNWFPARAMRASAWSGTLVFGALALLIWARPFSQMPLGSPPRTISETASGAAKPQTSVGSTSEAKPVAPSPLRVKSGPRKPTPSPISPSQPAQNGVARPQKPAPAAKIKGSMRFDAEPPMPPAPRLNPRFDSSAPATLPPIPSSTNSANASNSANGPSRAPLPRPQETARALETPRADSAAIRPDGLTRRAAAPASDADSRENRGAKQVAPAAKPAAPATAKSAAPATAKSAAPATAPSNSLRARAEVSPPASGVPVLPQVEQNLSAPRDANGAMNQNRVAAGLTDFGIVISEAAPEQNRQAVLGSVPTTGGLFRPLPNQRAGSFGGAGGRGGGGRGGSGGGFGSVGGGFGGGARGRRGTSDEMPVVPQAALPTVPNAAAVPNGRASQFGAPQQATNPALQNAPGLAFNTVPGIAQNDALSNRVGAAMLQRWTLTLLSPRSVEGALVRVELPPSLRVAEAPTEANFRGDLVANRAVTLRFLTRGARGGEKISVIVEQNGVGLQSKPVATRVAALPTPKN